VSQGDLPSANSRSDTTPWCHSLRLRRFATPVPTGKMFNRGNTPMRSGNSFAFGSSRTSTPTGKDSNRIDTPVRTFFLHAGDTEIVDYTATLFYSISIKHCRGRRPRRPEKKKRLLCVWLHTNSRLKSKICCFPGRRVLVATRVTRRFAIGKLPF